MPRSATTASRKTRRTSPKKAKPAAPKRPKRIAAKKAKAIIPKRIKRAAPKRATRAAPKKTGQSSVAAMQARIEALEAELQKSCDGLDEALEYQKATSEVLNVISRSDATLPSVLENLVETATRLCQADHGYVFRREQDRHHLIASFGVDPEFRDYMVANPFVPDRGTLSGRVALEHKIVHIENAATDPEYTLTEAQQRGNLRTGLGVPLLRGDDLLGISLPQVAANRTAAVQALRTKYHPYSRPRRA